MKYASIIALVSGDADDPATVYAAAEMAKREGAGLKVIPAYPLYSALAWTNMYDGGAFAAGAFEEIAVADRKVRSDMARLVESARETLGIGGPASPSSSIIFFDEDRLPWSILSREAPLADVIVVGAATVRSEGFWSGIHTEALMSLRIPLLIVRAKQALEGGRVAIAWDGGMPSGRAVKAALPLLRAADEVFILQDPQTMTEAEMLAGDPARLEAYLLAQGVGPVTTKLIRGADEGAALLAATEALGAACLVSGAFGHSRLGEFFGGGATRRFVAEPIGPHLLLAH